MDGGGSSKPISKTDVETIRDRISGCHDLAHSIRGKAFQLNGTEAKKDKESAEKTEPGDIAEEFKHRLSDLRELLDEAFTSLSAFV